MTDARAVCACALVRVPTLQLLRSHFPFRSRATSHTASMGNIDSVPILSQAKSLGQVIGGDAAGARRTQESFSKTCPVVSQARSAVEAASGDDAAARRTQEEFLDNAKTSFPIVSQAYSAAQLVVGDAQGARETQDKFSQRCVGISQARSVVEAVSGDHEAARQTQEEFLGLPIVLPV